MSNIVHKLWHIACLSFFLILLQSWTHAELYTAVVTMETLMQTHKRVVDELEYYIVKEEERIGLLTRNLDRYKLEHEKAMEDVINYLGNPLNAFSLIKRLTTELYDIEESITNGTEYIKNVTMNPDLKYPTLEDLAGAALGLTRVQTTYNLSVHDLSQGIINKVQYSSPMTADDCYDLARALYYQEDYENTVAWAMEALRKLHEEPGLNSSTEIELLEYISFSHYLNDDVKSALEWTKKLLALDPEHSRARGNVPHYKRIIAEREMTTRGRQGKATEDNPSELEVCDVDANYTKEIENCKVLCRGEMEIPKSIAKRLKCRYLTENHPFLRLAPLKVEQVYISPDVFVFHEVISDEEIRLIQEMAIPKFKHALVHDPETGELVPTDDRISKSAWLSDAESVAVARLSRRVRDMTGLSTASSEFLQVLNYGIGGHYESHYDFFEPDNINDNWYWFRTEDDFDEDGDRVATALFYMSEVAEGGATVFPKLGLSVFPVKNSALFWTNLHQTGEGDLATRHAACPVLRGSKWVCTKWLHERGQEMLKPCNLKGDIQRKSPCANQNSSRYFSPSVTRGLVNTGFLLPTIEIIPYIKSLFVGFFEYFKYLPGNDRNYIDLRGPPLWKSMLSNTYVHS